MKENTHDVASKRDADGRAVLGVKLSNREVRAWVYPQDYDRVLRAGGSGNWFAARAKRGHEYVRVTCNGGSPVPVSRVISGAASGQHIRFRDSNHLNLRRSNLEPVQIGSSKVLKASPRNG